MSSIAPTAAATAASLSAPTPSSSASGAAPTQVDFLKLLMAQMQNQDPSNPTSGTDYVTQMAQFASVQGITQLNSSITNLLAMQGLTQGVGLIGKSVTYTDASGKTASGAVSSVTMVGGQPQLVINNTNVGMSQIQTVQASAKRSNTAAASSTTGN
jgi:flagellar basal-body rod modification protein FlgD